MRTRIYAAAATLAVATLAATPALAFQLNPMSRVFAPSGSEATQSFEVVNAGADRIALEVSMATLERDESYLETNTNADDDFLIFPPQIILPAGGRQTIRVTWLGDPNPARERAYRIIVHELPIEIVDPAAKTPTQATGQVRIMLTYKGSVFIRPRNAVPKLALETVAPAKGDGGANLLALTVGNSGSAGAVVLACTVHLTSGAKMFDLPALAMTTMQKSRILAGGRRRYLLPWPAMLPVGPVTASGRCDAEP